MIRLKVYVQNGDGRRIYPVEWTFNETTPQGDENRVGNVISVYAEQIAKEFAQHPDVAFRYLAVELRREPEEQ